MLNETINVKLTEREAWVLLQFLRKESWRITDAQEHTLKLVSLDLQHAMATYYNEEVKA